MTIKLAGCVGSMPATPPGLLAKHFGRERGGEHEPWAPPPGTQARRSPPPSEVLDAFGDHLTAAFGVDATGAGDPSLVPTVAGGARGAGCRPGTTGGAVGSGPEAWAARQALWDAVAPTAML